MELKQASMDNNESMKFMYATHIYRIVEINK